MISQKFQYIENYFKGKSLDGKSVLDAGTGRTSAWFLAQRNPEHLTLLAYEGDLRKGEQANQELINKSYENYTLKYGDISKSSTFSDSTFDLILADYLIGEITPSRLSDTFKALFKFLKKGGEVIFIDREAYWGYEPKFDYISMDKIEGDPELSKRNPRDLTEIVNLYMMIAKSLTLFLPTIRTFEYPSDWIIPLIKNSGLQINDTQFFESKEEIDIEFRQRLEWAKGRIKNLNNSDLQNGLIQEIEKLEKEYNSRAIGNDDYYPRKHYLISAKK